MPATQRDVKLTVLQLECLKVLAGTAPRPLPKKGVNYYLVYREFLEPEKAVYLTASEYSRALPQQRSVSSRLIGLRRRGFLVDRLWGKYHLWMPGPMMDALIDRALLP